MRKKLSEIKISKKKQKIMPPSTSVKEMFDRNHFFVLALMALFFIGPVAATTHQLRWGTAVNDRFIYSVTEQGNKIETTTGNATMIIGGLDSLPQDISSYYDVPTATIKIESEIFDTELLLETLTDLISPVLIGSLVVPVGDFDFLTQLCLDFQTETVYSISINNNANEWIISGHGTFEDGITLEQSASATISKDTGVFKTLTYSSTTTQGSSTTTLTLTFTLLEYIPAPDYTLFIIIGAAIVGVVVVIIFILKRR